MTKTTTYTSTKTEARVRYVMDKVEQDLLEIATSKLITYDQVVRWTSDLRCFLNLSALVKFEVQFHHASFPRTKGFVYTIHESSSEALTIDQVSGDFDLGDYPKDTLVCLIVFPHKTLSNEFVIERDKRGWGPGGHELTGNRLPQKQYCKDEYGVKRGFIS